MLDAIITALREIIDFRKKARKDKKVGLEIKKLEEEQQAKQRLIQPASLDDVKRFDPHYADIERTQRPPIPRLAEVGLPSRPALATRLGCVFLMAILLVLLVLLIWHFFR